MGFGHHQPPASGTDAIDIAGNVALLVLAILERAALVGEGERAEEDVADRVAGEDQADIALRAAELGETLKPMLGADLAGEGGVSDISGAAGVPGTELDHPAAIDAVRHRRTGKGRVRVEEHPFASDLGGVAGRPSGGKSVLER